MNIFLYKLKSPQKQGRVIAIVNKSINKLIRNIKGFEMETRFIMNHLSASVLFFV